VFRLLTFGVSVLAIPVLGASLCRQLLLVPDLSGNVFWFLSGALVVGIVFMWRGPSLIRLVVVHELSHAVAGWLMGARVRSIEASDSRGGAVQSELESWGGEVISLAPYFIQPVTLVLIGVKALARPVFDPFLCLAMGAAWAGFYFDVWTTLRVSQPDISDTGGPYSVVVLVALNLLISGLVLASVSPDTSVSGFLVDGPVAIWTRAVALRFEILGAANGL
jgi:hypothetical protein